MDIFIIEVDGLDVAITQSEEAAAEHARRLASEEPFVAVQVLRIRERAFEVHAGFAPAEAATA